MSASAASAGASGGSSQPFVTSLRVRPESISLWSPGQQVITIRVEMPEVWDTLRVEASPATTISAVKEASLEVLFPDRNDADEFVMKFNGYELRDEDGTLESAGVKDGSTLLLTFRRRRPVRA